MLCRVLWNLVWYAIFSPRKGCVLCDMPCVVLGRGVCYLNTFVLLLPVIFTISVGERVCLWVFVYTHTIEYTHSITLWQRYMTLSFICSNRIPLFLYFISFLANTRRAQSTFDCNCAATNQVVHKFAEEFSSSGITTGIPTKLSSRGNRCPNAWVIPKNPIGTYL